MGPIARFRADIVESDPRHVPRRDASQSHEPAPNFLLTELRVSTERPNRFSLCAAYRAARQRAEAYAKAADLKIARVLAIYDGGESSMPIPYARTGNVSAQAVAPASPPPVAFNSGINTTEVNVRVDFALSRK